MQHLQLTSVDGVELDAAVHPAAATPVRGAVLIVHGVTVDMDEGGGMFVRLADQLSGAGFDVARFSFRGHGASGGTPRGVTIAGECLDLQSAVGFVPDRFTGPLSIVAASFGAVSTVLSLPWLAADLHRLVLWNPVLDLERTFLEPELPWGKQNFGEAGRNQLLDKGFLTVDGEFELGQALFAEFARYRPLDDLLTSTIDTLIVHGDRDSAVSYEIAADVAQGRSGGSIISHSPSDH